VEIRDGQHDAIDRCTPSGLLLGRFFGSGFFGSGFLGGGFLGNESLGEGPDFSRAVRAVRAAASAAEVGSRRTLRMICASRVP
jgi:hypothetical protein